VEQGPRGPLFGGRSLSPWEVVEVYADLSGNQLARALVLGGEGEGVAQPSQLLRISPGWFKRPLLEVEA
jgi:hypothetical protein